MWSVFFSPLLTIKSNLRTFFFLNNTVISKNSTPQSWSRRPPAAAALHILVVSMFKAHLIQRIKEPISRKNKFLSFLYKRV